MEFNIEAQYQHYLQLVGLNEANMHPTQRTETRRAFYGGFSHSIVLIGNTIELSEEETTKVFDDLNSQIERFWLTETVNTRSN